MRALTIAVTYILLAPFPVLSIWLSSLNNRILYWVGIGFGVVAALLGFAGIFSLVSDVLSGKSYGDNINTLLLSIALLSVSLGGFIIATAYGLLKNYLYLANKHE
jgi:hypothetical protein